MTQEDIVAYFARVRLRSGMSTVALGTLIVFLAGDGDQRHVTGVGTVDEASRRASASAKSAPVEAPLHVATVAPKHRIDWNDVTYVSRDHRGMIEIGLGRGKRLCVPLRACHAETPDELLATLSPDVEELDDADLLELDV